jgi:hypothetical protein
MNKYISQSKFSILLVIMGFIAISLAIFITPTVASRYFSAKHNISPEGIKRLHDYRLFLSFGGLFLIICGLILPLVRNIHKRLQSILSFLNKLDEMIFSKIKDKVFFTIVAGIYIVLFAVVSANLSNPYLWFDEAGQFWISKGLNHYSNPLQNPNGLSDVIVNNANHNLDPGGFSILLHFWTEISNSFLWLRLLPFLFFIGTIISFIYLSYKWTRNFKIALLMGFLPFLFSQFISMGFEIRAYSMEYLGAVLAIVSVESLKEKISYFRLFIWGCLLSIFMTSRYSIIIIIFATSLCVVLLIWISYKKFRDKLLALFLYALPIFITLSLIYFFTLSHQNPELSKLAYLDYLIDDWTLLYKPIENLYYLLFVFFLVFILIFSLRKKTIFLKYQTLLFVSITSNFLFIALAFLGKYPWLPTDKRGLPYFVITLLCFSFILGEFLLYYLKTPSFIKYISVLIIVVSFLYIYQNSLIREADDQDFLGCLGNIDYKNVSNIYVDRWGNPEVRYLFEYGILKPLQSGNYPEKFTFQDLPNFSSLHISTLDEWYQTQPKMNDLLEYDLLITPELADYD